MDISQITNLTKKQMKNIERKFVTACIQEGVTGPTEMILMATRTLRNINKDVVAGYKAASTRKRYSKAKNTRIKKRYALDVSYHM